MIHDGSHYDQIQDPGDDISGTEIDIGYALSMPEPGQPSVPLLDNRMGNQIGTVSINDMGMTVVHIDDATTRSRIFAGRSTPKPMPVDSPVAEQRGDSSNPGLRKVLGGQLKVLSQWLSSRGLPPDWTGPLDAIGWVVCDDETGDVVGYDHELAGVPLMVDEGQTGYPWDSDDISDKDRNTAIGLRDKVSL